MELPETISENERLYRVVKRSKPEHITSERRASSALFKDTKGISVDRDGKREEDEIIRFITEGVFQRRAKAIALLTARYCYEIGADVESAPTPQNPFHANIWLDKENENKRNLQALQLADHCRIVYYNDTIDWIDAKETK